jgi:hypothetical protein
MLRHEASRPQAASILCSREPRFFASGLRMTPSLRRSTEVRLVSAFRCIVELTIEEWDTGELPVDENRGAIANRVDSKRIS